jgi:hypothetical protein
MIASLYKQQILPLRCTPVGMTTIQYSKLQTPVPGDDAFAGAALDLVLKLWRGAVVRGVGDLDGSYDRPVE